MDTISEQYRVQLLCTGLIDDDTSRPPVSHVATKIHTINLAAKEKLLSLAQIDIPWWKRVPILTKSQFNRTGIELVLPHPAHNNFDEVLQ